MNTLDFLMRSVQVSPQRIALMDHKHHCTYQQLADDVTHLAAGLTHLGLGRGARCALIGDFPLISVQLYFALSWIGAVFVPMNPNLTEAEQKAWINTLELDAVFMGRDSIISVDLLRRKGRIPSVTQYVALDFTRGGYLPFESLLTREAAAPVPVPGRQTQMNLIMLTSGRSGHQRGVAMSCGSIFSAMERNHLQPQRCSDTPRITLVCMSMFHIAGFLSIMDGIRAGNTMALHEWVDTKHWHDRIGENAIDECVLSSKMLQEIVDSSDKLHIALPKLRRIQFGWDLIPASTVHRAIKLFPACDFQQFYGLTELVDASVLTLTKEQLILLYHNDISRGQSAVGIPRGEGVMVVDPEEHPTQSGEIGEIAARPLHPILGWYDSTDGFIPFSGGLFHTGDLAYRDETGCLHLVGYVSLENREGSQNPAITFLPHIHKNSVHINYPQLYRRYPEPSQYLLSFAQSIYNCSSLPELAECYLSEIQKLISADIYCIQLVEDYLEALYIETTSVSYDLKWLRPHLRRMNGYVLKRGESSRVNGIFNEWQSNASIEDLIGPDKKSVLCAPLYTEDLVEVGALIIGRDVPISDRDASLMQTISNIIGSALVSLLQRQQYLENSESAETALECLAFCVLITNTEGRIRYGNKPAYRILFNETHRTLKPLLLETIQSNISYIKTTGISLKKSLLHYFEPGATVSTTLSVKTFLDRNGTDAVSIVNDPKHTPELELLRARLSPRALEFAMLMLQGLSDREIEKAMAISSHTVNYHLRQLFQEFGVNRRSQLVALLYSLLYQA